MTNLNLIKKNLNRQGFHEIASGVYLMTRDNIKADQTLWDDTDKYKFFDFSGFAYWIITNDGIKPIGFQSLKSAIRL